MNGDPDARIAFGALLVAASVGLIVWLSGIAGVILTLLIIIMLCVGLFFLLVRV